MGEPCLMDGVQTAERLTGQLERLGEGQPASLCLQILIQRLALQSLHHQERPPIGGDVAIQHVDNVVVAQAGECLGLEAQAIGHAAAQVRLEDLDDHRSLEAYVLGDIDLAHRTFPELVEQAVRGSL